MSKHAEKLMILKDHGQALLGRLYTIKGDMADVKRRPFMFAQSTLPLQQKLSQKFPDFPLDTEKTKGFEVISHRMQDVLEVLDPWFACFRDLLEFRNAAYSELDDLSQNITDFRFDTNPFLMMDFMDVLVLYVQLTLMLSKTTDKRTILSIYNLAFAKVNGTSETNITRIAKLFSECDDPNPFKKLQEQFFRLGQLVGKSLLNLGQVMEKRSHIYLTQKRPLELLSDPDKIAYPSVQSEYFELMISERLYLWIVYGFLIVPEALGVKPEKPYNIGRVEITRGLDLCKLALEESFVTTLHGDEGILIHEPYEELFSRYKNQNISLKEKKERRMLRVAEDVCASNAHELHNDKRMYLRLQLKSILKMLTDSPGLLGPKFQLVLALLHLSKEEVLWYFRHFGYVPKYSIKKFKERIDPFIAEFFYFMDEIIKLCLNHKNVISTYSMEFIRRCYLNQVTTMYNEQSSVFEGQTKTIMDSVISDLTNGTNFVAMRLNFKRIQAYLSGYRFKHAQTAVKDLFSKLNTVMLLSRHVDEIEMQIDESCSLKELYYYRPIVHNIFKSSLGSYRNQPLCAISFLHLLNTYPDVAHRFCSADRQRIGKEAVRFADLYFVAIANYIEKAIEKLGGSDGLTLLTSQLTSEHAAEMLRIRTLNKGEEPPAAGSESSHGANKTIENIYNYERNLTQLLFAANSQTTVTVFDVVFHPLEYVRDKIEVVIRSHIQRVFLVPDEHPDKKQSAKNVVPIRFQQPTEAWKLLQSFLSRLKIVESCVNINIEELVLKCLMEEGTHPSYYRSPFDPPTAVETEKSIPPMTNNNLVMQIAKYYSELINNVTKLRLIYSPLRRCFTSQAGTQLSYLAEHYTDQQELVTLCRFIGPLGVRVIDQELLSGFLSKLTDVKTTLNLFSSQLREIEASIYKDDVLSEASRKLRGFEQLFAQAVNIGALIMFRRNLHEALGVVAREYIPLVYNTVNVAYEQYPPNIFRDNRLMNVDGFAKECGIPTTSDDHAFKRVAESLADSSVWELLPTGFAALLTTPAMRDSYDVNIEAWPNNAYLAVIAMVTLMINIISLKSVDPAKVNVLDLIEAAFRRFAEVASMICLAMKVTRGNEAAARESYIFVDKVIQNSQGFLKQSTWEALNPYALMRATYVQCYEPTQRKVEGTGAPEAE